MGELLRKRAWSEPVTSHVVRGRNAGCLHAVGAAKSDLERGTRGEPNAQVQGRPLGLAEARTGGGVPCNAQLGRWWRTDDLA